MFEERQWGTYRVLDIARFDDDRHALTKHLIIKPGRSISYQYHLCREEIWTIIKGDGVVVLDGEVRKVSNGDVVRVLPRQLHTIKANKELHIIEVQLGKPLTEEDIVRFPAPEQLP